jgi:mannosyltransferase OCH1-like enzyme
MNTLKIRPRLNNNNINPALNGMHTTFQNFSLTHEILTFSGKHYSETYILTNPPPSKEDDFIEEQHYDNECITCSDHFLFVEEFNIEGDSDFFQKSRQLKRLHQDELFHSYTDNEDVIEYEYSDDEDASEPIYQTPYNLMTGFSVVSKLGMTKILSGKFNISRLIDIYGGVYSTLSNKKYREKSYVLKFPRIKHLAAGANSLSETLEMLKMVNNRSVSYTNLLLSSGLTSIGSFDNLSGHLLGDLQFASKNANPSPIYGFDNSRSIVATRYATGKTMLSQAFELVERAGLHRNYTNQTEDNASPLFFPYASIRDVDYRKTKFSITSKFITDYIPPLYLKASRNAEFSPFSNVSKKRVSYPNILSSESHLHRAFDEANNGILKHNKNTLFSKRIAPIQPLGEVFLQFVNGNSPILKYENENRNYQLLNNYKRLTPDTNNDIHYQNYPEQINNSSEAVTMNNNNNVGEISYNKYQLQMNGLQTFRNSFKNYPNVRAMIGGPTNVNTSETYPQNTINNTLGLWKSSFKRTSMSIDIGQHADHFDNNRTNLYLNSSFQRFLNLRRGFSRTKPYIDLNDPNITITRDYVILYNSSNQDINVVKFKDVNVNKSKKYEKYDCLEVDGYIAQYLDNYNKTKQSVETPKKIDQFKSVSQMNIFDVHNLIETNKNVTSSVSPVNIPLKVYTCWHTKSLPPQMENNYHSLVRNNPELEFSLFDEIECRNFIKKYFDNSVLNAYDSLIPSSYKSDLWRYCVLHKNGGIYIDIKYNCVNGFKLIELCKKEHFVLERKNIEWERNAVGLYTALIVVKPYNDIMSKCIKQIVENVSNRYYGFNALYPTGPGLLGSIYFKNRTNEDVVRDIDAFFSGNQMQINYGNKPALEIYSDYRKEQLAYQNAMHYSLIWETSNIYKLFIKHKLKRDFSVIVDSTKKSLLVICHIGNFDVFEKMRHYISFVQSVRNNYNVDVVFNLVKGITSDNIMKLNVYFPEANIVVSENYGFDIGSFYHILNIIKEQNIEYDYILKIHTKSDDVKRFNVLDSIMSSRDKIIEILKALDEDPQIGCVSSNRSFQTDDFTERVRNKNHLNTLLNEFGLSGKDSNLPFPAGSMFWIRFDIIKRVYMQKDLLKICQSLNTECTFDYNWFYFAYYANVNNIKNPSALCNYYLKNRENLARNLFDAIRINSPTQKLRDGMIEHAHERMIAYAVNFCGNKIILV